VSEGKSVLGVWRRNTVHALVYDVLAAPVVVLLALVFARTGPFGAICLSIPLFGVRQLYSTTAKLEQVNQELLQLMVKAIEARDPYTSGHSRRVAHYSKIIARAIGLTPKRIERVGTAALLHDVGKIHEMYAPILSKPDKLTPDEWAIMQTHPIRSAELVATVSNLRDLVKPLRHHHENWDGSGYPDGLAGEEIPLESRIIMFADTIDAMTTDRPYREARGEADVRSEFIRQRGRQFDPQICDRLLASPLWSLLFAPDQREPTPISSRAVLPATRIRRVASV
jgi:HD-GYP domain-containing protein (c-di-GMP phosphodiesterase class II)